MTVLGKARFTMRWRPAGSDGFISVSGRGVSLRIEESTERVESPVNGRVPVVSS
jgi:hypothetical protein